MRRDVERGWPLALASALVLVIACSDDPGSNAGAGNGCSTTLSPGSYARSCTGCAMRGTILSCQSCGDGHGGSPSAELDTCSCPTQTATDGISNNHGVLECGASGTAGCTTAVPAGSFAQSCTGCTMNGTTLSCEGCGDGRGGHPSSKLDTCSCPSTASTNAISNNHGVLECGHEGSSSSSSGCKSDSDCSGECPRCSSGHCDVGYKSSISGECVF